MQESFGKGAAAARVRRFATLRQDMSILQEQLRRAQLNMEQQHATRQHAAQEFRTESEQALPTPTFLSMDQVASTLTYSKQQFT